MELKNKTEERIWHKLLEEKYYSSIDTATEKYTQNTTSAKNREIWKRFSEIRKTELKNFTEFHFYNTLTLELNDVASKGAIQFINQIAADKELTNLYQNGSKHDYIDNLLSEYLILHKDNLITREDIINLTNGTNKKYNKLLNYAILYNTGDNKAIQNFAQEYNINELDIMRSLFMYFDKNRKCKNIKFYFKE